MKGPVFEYRTLTNLVHSAIRFRVAAEGSGSRIRAVGYPINARDVGRVWRLSGGPLAERGHGAVKIVQRILPAKYFEPGGRVPCHWEVAYPTLTFHLP